MNSASIGLHSRITHFYKQSPRPHGFVPRSAITFTHSMGLMRFQVYPRERLTDEIGRAGLSFRDRSGGLAGPKFDRKQRVISPTVGLRFGLPAYPLDGRGARPVDALHRHAHRTAAPLHAPLGTRPGCGQSGSHAAFRVAVDRAVGPRTAFGQNRRSHGTTCRRGGRAEQLARLRGVVGNLPANRAWTPPTCWPPATSNKP